MSEFHVIVVELGKIGKHPNADTLSITQVMGGYPCIIRTGEFQPGDKAVYVPVDSLVPLKDPRFTFLSDRADKEYQRVKAKKLRGIFSMGLLTKADPSWEVGQNVQEALGILKWEPEIDKISTNGECEKDWGFMPRYTDIEGLRKYKKLLQPGEEVVLTEKIHGANFRATFNGYQNPAIPSDVPLQLWVGSHNTIKRMDPNNLWWKAAIAADLSNKLSKLIGPVVLYGEVYGQVQDLKYGAKPGEVFLRFFDALDSKTNRYLDYYDFRKLMEDLDLDVAPPLYIGPWSEDLIALSEGKSTLADNVREGFVVRPTKERYDNHVGRVILKMVGEGYHLRKEK